MSTRSKELPEHIFISFCDSDKEIVEKLSNDLEEVGIPVWTDYKKLVPGTPDWESAIRDAIDRSFAVLLVASSDSRKSVYVKGEINVATAKGRNVYPVWVCGEDWPDCIPLGMTTAQYIDIRGSKYTSGLAQIKQTLGGLIDATIPKHYSVSPIRREVEVGKQERYIIQARVPPKCVCIELSDEGERSSGAGGLGVIMKSYEYGSIQALLDDLYVNYLHSKFMPYTYGKDWVLVRDGQFGGQVAIPWSWLTCNDWQQYLPERDWGLHTTPEQCGMTSKDHWYLTTNIPGPRYGLAVNDRRYLSALLRSPKAESFFTRAGYLRYEEASHVKSADFQFLFVLRQGRFRFQDVPKNCVLVQTEKQASEKEFKFWLPWRDD